MSDIEASNSNQIPLQTFNRVKSEDQKELNIFTGLYYKISVKSIPNGVVTYELEPRTEDHLIQLALDYTEDFDPPDLELGIGGDLLNNALWTIIPEAIKQNNYTRSSSRAQSQIQSADYQLKVLSQPDGNLTYTHGTSWGGRYMELDLNHPENYIPGANMYSSTLWHFNSCEIADYFTIHNSDSRRQPNFVTFSNESSERGQLMQLGTKDLENYDLKGPFRHDALWSFKPMNYQLFAEITDFTFEVPSDTEISDEAYPLGVMDEIIINKNNSKLDFSFELPETFNLSFLQSFKCFNENNIKIDTKGFISQLKFLKGKEGLDFEKKSNTQWGCILGTKYTFEQQFDVKDEESEIKVKGYCSTIKGLEISFKANVKITTRAECANEKDGSSLGILDIFDTQVVEYLLKIERFAGKVISKVQPKAQPKVNQRIRNAPKVEEEEKIPAVVLCQVGGRFKCSCGLDTYLNIN